MAIALKPTKRGGHYCGRSIALPYLGYTTIPANGILTVEDDEKAHAFVKALSRDWEYVDPKDDPNPAEIEAPKGEEIRQKSESDELNQGGNGQSIFDDLDDEEKKEYITALPDMTRAQLETLAKAFPRSQWNGMKKEQLVEYIKGKLGA